MKHIKKFNEDFGGGFLIFGAGALLKIIYNTIKRDNINKGIRKKDFSKLEYLITQFKDSKTLIGEIIDNEKECQIIYEYGGSDNLIIFYLNKIEKIFTFKWDFSQPIFPFLKFSNFDDIELDLNDEEYQKILEIFDNLKNEHFKKQK